MENGKAGHERNDYILMTKIIFAFK